MARYQLDGPPWGNNIDPEEAYLRGQAGSAGSGLIGGLSQAWYGGAVEPPAERQAEVRREIRALAREKQLLPPAPGEPDAGSDRR